MSASIMLRGAGTALVTPFNSQGEVDLDVFRVLVRRQVKNGVRMLVPCGTTGEAATLSALEKESLVRACAEEAQGHALVVAGTGSNDTRVAIESACAAAAWGADAVLSLAPPYNKPPQDGLFEHFRKVAEKSPVPVVLYNVPGRTGCNLEAETTLALAEVDGIAGVKEASGDLAQCMQILRGRPAGFAVLSGEDAWTLPLMALGAEGVISVVGNADPVSLAELCETRSGARARTLHAKLLPLMNFDFVESNPIPIKAVLARLGWLENELRAPLRPLDASYMEELEEVLSALDLVEAMAVQGGVR